LLGCACECNLSLNETEKRVVCLAGAGSKHGHKLTSRLQTLTHCRGRVPVRVRRPLHLASPPDPSFCERSSGLVRAPQAVGLARRPPRHLRSAGANILCLASWRLAWAYDLQLRALSLGLRARKRVQTTVLRSRAATTGAETGNRLVVACRPHSGPSTWAASQWCPARLTMIPIIKWD